MKRILVDNRGISVMQDAVLFCLMVSISGAILMPALTSNIIASTYIEKEMEERANEVLYQLMVCRVDEFSHLNAETIISSLGIDQGLLKSVVDNLLKREQLHRTYADLCTECVSCQFKFLGYRINILTQNFTDMIKLELEKFLCKQLGNEYGYNLTVMWNPIVGFDFGGEIAVGETVPAGKNVYTSSVYATMPPSLFTEVGFSIEKFKYYISEEVGIEEDFYNCKNGAISKGDFKELLKRAMIELVNKAIWEGFDYNGDGDFDDVYEMKSIVDMVLDYIFYGLQNIMQHTIDEALNMVNDVIVEGLGNNFDDMIYNDITKRLTNLVGKTTGDTIDNIMHDIRGFIKKEARNFVEETIGEKIESMVEKFIERIDFIVDIGVEIMNWLFEQINFCRAKITLAIWGV